MIKTGFVKISVLKTSSLFPIHHLVLIPSPAHRSDHSTIIQASITQFKIFDVGQLYYEIKILISRSQSFKTMQCPTSEFLRHVFLRY